MRLRCNSRPDLYKNGREYMKNQQCVLWKIIVTLTCLVLFSAPAFAAEEPGAAEEPDKWETAGKEISEAAKAVGSASGEAWQKTKEKTAETWDKTKEKSAEVAEKTAEVSGEVVVETAEKSKGFWQKTKETTKSWLDKARAKIHQMTAPKTEPEPAPQPESAK